MKICIAYINYNEDSIIYQRLNDLLPFNEFLDVLIVDNSGKLILENKDTTLRVCSISRGNVGFSGGANIALDYFINQQYKVGLILNPDVDLEFETLLSKYHRFIDSQYAGWMFPAYNELGEIQYTSIRLNKFKTRYHIDLNAIGKDIITSTDYLAGCAILLNMDHIGDLRFDTNFFLYYEEVDFSKQLLKRNKKIGSYQGLTISRQSNSKAKKIRSVSYMWKSSAIFGKKYNLGILPFLEFRLFLILFLIKAYIDHE